MATVKNVREKEKMKEVADGKLLVVGLTAVLNTYSPTWSPSLVGEDILKQRKLPLNEKFR